MYILIGILFAICILFFIINFYRRKCIIRKICCMGHCEKLNLLNSLAEPFGFCYLPDPDVMVSRTDAWQKDFGYCSLYDKSASHFNMVFDCAPVYFDYADHTWMIEFWKGQYGINIGGEIGIYKADSILSPKQYDHTLFHGVSEGEFLPVSMDLNFKGQPLFSVRREHWWLTGFRMGAYCEPEDLTLDISITFPDECMLRSFVDSLNRLSYNKCKIYICDLIVSLSFSIPHCWQPRSARRLSARFSQWKNRILCKLFIFITRPFTCTMDRILYLYFFLPVAFRRLLCFKRNRKQKFSKKQCRRKCKQVSKKLCRKKTCKNYKQDFHERKNKSK